MKNLYTLDMNKSVIHLIKYFVSYNLFFQVTIFKTKRIYMYVLANITILEVYEPFLPYFFKSYIKVG